MLNGGSVKTRSTVPVSSSFIPARQSWLYMAFHFIGFLLYHKPSGSRPAGFRLVPE